MLDQIQSEDDDLGVPARKLAVGLSAHSPRRLASSPPAGYPLQSLTQSKHILMSF
jgi:hypothetical protein